MPDAPTLSSADVTAIAEAVAARVQVPALLDGIAARNYVGLSKSGWHRARSAGLLPAPVRIEGSGEKWRRVDLDRYIAGLKPARRRK